MFCLAKCPLQNRNKRDVTSKMAANANITISGVLDFRRTGNGEKRTPFPVHDKIGRLIAGYFNSTLHCEVRLVPAACPLKRLHEGTGRGVLSHDS